jgi:hypothetical protein
LFGSLDFLYLPSRDAAADMAHYVDGLGGSLVFAIERFGTRVAMVQLTQAGPPVLLAEHLEGDQRRGWRDGATSERRFSETGLLRA